MKMKYNLQNVFLVILLTVFSHGDDINRDVSETQCKCVPSSFCGDENSESTGAGLLDIR